MVTATDIDNLERMDHNNNQNRRMVNDAMWCITIGILHMMTNYAMSYSTSYATVNKESIKNQQRQSSSSTKADETIGKGEEQLINYALKMFTHGAGFFLMPIVWLAKFILIAVWRIIQTNLWGMVTTVRKPEVYSDGMNINRWFEEFEDYLEKKRIRDSNKRANELIKHLDERSATILRKALREEDE